MTAIRRGVRLEGLDGSVIVSEIADPDKEGVEIALESSGRLMTVQLGWMEAYALLGRYDKRLETYSTQVGYMITVKSPPAPEEEGEEEGEELVAEEVASE